MATQVEVCNMALDMIGAKPINLITDEGHAEVCSRQFERALDELIRSHPWSVAKSRRELVETTAPSFGWAHAYILPEDFVRMLKLNGVDAANQPSDFFELEGGLLLTDEEQAQIVYIRKPLVPDITLDAGTYSPIYLFDDSISLTIEGTCTGTGSTIANFQWTIVSGPGDAVILTPTELETDAEFYAVGDYVLKLQCFIDGELIAEDTATIPVHAVAWKFNVAVQRWNFPTNDVGAAYNPGSTDNVMLVWVKTGANTRQLVREITAQELLNAVPDDNGAVVVDIVEAFKTAEFRALPGVERVVFVSITDAGKEWIMGTGVNSVPDGGAIAQQDIPLIPDTAPFTPSYPEEDYGPWKPIVSGYDPAQTYSEFKSVAAVVIPNYKQRGAAFASFETKPAT